MLGAAWHGSLWRGLPLLPPLAPLLAKGPAPRYTATPPQPLPPQLAAAGALRVLFQVGSDADGSDADLVTHELGRRAGESAEEARGAHWREWGGLAQASRGLTEVARNNPCAHSSSSHGHWDVGRALWGIYGPH